MKHKGLMRLATAGLVAFLVGCTGKNPRVGLGGGLITVNASHMGVDVKSPLPTVNLTYTEEIEKNLDLNYRLAFLNVSQDWGDKLYDDGWGRGWFIEASVGPQIYVVETARSRLGFGLGIGVFYGQYEVDGMAAAVHHVDLSESVWGLKVAPELIWEVNLAKDGSRQLLITVGYNFSEVVPDDVAHVDLDGRILMFEYRVAF